MNNITKPIYAADKDQTASNMAAKNVMQANNIFFNANPLKLRANDVQTGLFIEQLTYLVTSESFAANTLTKFHSQISSKELVPCNDAMVFAALLGVPSILATIAKRLNRASAAFQFPEKVLQCRQVMHSNIDYRTFAADAKTTTQSWFHYASKILNVIHWTPQAQYLLSCVLQAAPDREHVQLDFHNLTMLFQGNVQYHSYCSDVLKAFCQKNSQPLTALCTQKKLLQFRDFCQQKVIGQTEAMNKLCEMLGCAFSNSAIYGPLGVTTFMGSPGTGKTSLAELVVDGLNQFFSPGYQLLSLNMEQYSHKDAAAKLFGSGSQYVDSALGDLTTAVLINPKTVILFDEIEKAHPHVRQALLSLLEKGVVQDHTSKMSVDFSQCFIIFTTNLGSQCAMLPESNHINLPSLLMNEANEHSLSPELINRLSKGYISLFRPLKIEHLLDVAEAQSQQLEANQPIIWPNNTAEILLETLGGELNPRTIKSQASKLQQQILQHLFSRGIEVEHSTPIFIDIPEDISNSRIAVVTDNVDLAKKLKTIFPSVEVFYNVRGFIKYNQHSSVDALLLHNIELPPDVVIQQKQPLQIFRFGSNLVKDAVLTAANIKCYPIDTLNKNTLQALLNKVAKRTRLLRSADSYRRRNMQVHFDFQIKQESKGITVQLVNPIYSIHFDHKDFPQAYMKVPYIPQQNFNHVFGMDALKRQFNFIIKCLQSEKLVEIDIPAGILLSGPPGTGKSHFARAVAGECGVPFISVNAADLMQGNVVANINHLFKVAEQYAPSIVFLDEFDAIAMSRSHQGSLNHLAVNTLLTRMDGFTKQAQPVFVLAATNMAERLDPAVIRHGRFDKNVVFSLPDLSARKAFIINLSEMYALGLLDKECDTLAKMLTQKTFGHIQTLFREFKIETLSTQHKRDPHTMYQLLLEHIADSQSSISLQPLAEVMFNQLNTQSGTKHVLH
ncbi:AAA family ATPase [Rheinheimera oceanensis]|uniref:AAA family ATPase n=1 Tax=Rheinheimera oceanensis TaxID=2817449 RepID=UPI001BFEBCEA|nr:AAA family ATPase [Rheinheimera oceanensis]